MNLRASVVGWLLCLIVHVNASHYSYRVKRLVEARDDCAQYLEFDQCKLNQIVADNYPNDYDTKRLVHCILVELRCFNETALATIDPVIYNFFKPNCNDTEYEERTNKCLNDVRQELCANDHPLPMEQAYREFKCYYHQYGNVVEDEQYVPMTVLERLEAFVDCAAILDIPLSEYGNSSMEGLKNHEKFPCLIRCVAYKMGVYNDETGINLKYYYTMYSNGKTYDDYVKKGLECIGKIDKNLDKCQRAKAVLYDCFEQNLSIYYFLEELFINGDLVSFNKVNSIQAYNSYVYAKQKNS